MTAAVAIVWLGLWESLVVFQDVLYLLATIKCFEENMKNS